MLRQVVGPQSAAAMVSLGVPVDASRARELGLVWSVHPAAQLLEAALGLVHVAAKQPADFAKELIESVRAAGTGTHGQAVERNDSCSVRPWRGRPSVTGSLGPGRASRVGPAAQDPAERRGTHVVLLAQDLEVRVVNAITGELLRELTIDTNKDCRPRK